MARTFSRSPVTSDCENCPQHLVDIMRATPPEERAATLHLFRLRHYEPRETLYTEGERGEFVAMIREGLVKLSRFSDSGDERIVRLGMPGDTIGIGLMIDGRYHHTAIALTPVEVCMMPLRVLHERVACAPGFAQKFIAEWNASVGDAERFLTDLSTGTAHQRVARLLLYLHERSQAVDVPTIGREDIGALLGVTTETASRVIAEFKRGGLLVENAQGRWRFDREPLERISER